MKTIKVYGPGCKRCETVANLVLEEAEKLGIEVELSKITDMAQIAMAGVLSTPGLVINGTLVHSGSIPKNEEVANWLKS
ncbi:thioredoxin family protein [Polycladidibacter stylochi]|uniref:thioredoxin family protein n=1 Tax=Polycladidibacter stylochi TaxID=1807766 RepID=UPI0008364738|nr:thioredoxin family protein [Pseudovibrio stylochi]